MVFRSASHGLVGAVQHEAGEERGVRHLVGGTLPARPTCQFRKVGHLARGSMRDALRLNKHERKSAEFTVTRHTTAEQQSRVTRQRSNSHASHADVNKHTAKR